jgi:hypothetical protein
VSDSETLRDISRAGAFIETATSLPRLDLCVEAEVRVSVSHLVRLHGPGAPAAA